MNAEILYGLFTIPTALAIVFIARSHHTGRRLDDIARRMLKREHHR